MIYFPAERHLPLAVIGFGVLHALCASFGFLMFAEFGFDSWPRTIATIAFWLAFLYLTAQMFLVSLLWAYLLKIPSKKP